MTTNTSMKNHVTMLDFAATLGVTKAAISGMKKSGTIPADAFAKSGRSIFVHEKKALAALKSAPVPQRGRIPVWASKVGNKAMLKAIKDGRGGNGAPAVAEAA